MIKDDVIRKYGQSGWEALLEYIDLNLDLLVHRALNEKKTNKGEKLGKGWIIKLGTEESEMWEVIEVNINALIESATDSRRRVIAANSEVIIIRKE